MAFNLSLHKDTPERLLIIGCGDIGQRVADQLDPQAYHITGVRRSPVSNALPHLHYRVCDVTNPQALARVVAERFDIIIITMTPSERSDLGYKRAYVDTCRHLIDALNVQGLRPQLLLFVSSTSVYGQNDGSWVDESSPTAPDSFSGKRLLEAEHLIQNSGHPAVIVRFSGIYGPGRQRLIDQVRQHRASSSPHFTNRIHADDCAGVLAHLVRICNNTPLEPLYLATDSTPTPMVEVVNWLATQLGEDDVFSPDARNERGNKRIRNQRLLASGYPLKYPSFQQGYATLLDNIR